MQMKEIDLSKDTTFFSSIEFKNYSQDDVFNIVYSNRIKIKMSKENLLLSSLFNRLKNNQPKLQTL